MEAGRRKEEEGMSAYSQSSLQSFCSAVHEERLDKTRSSPTLSPCDIATACKAKKSFLQKYEMLPTDGS